MNNAIFLLCKEFIQSRKYDHDNMLRMIGVFYQNKRITGEQKQELLGFMGNR